MWAEQQLKKQLSRVLRRGVITQTCLWYFIPGKNLGEPSLQRTQTVTFPGWRITSYVRFSSLLAKAISLQVMDRGVTARQVIPNPISQKRLL